MNRTVLSLRRPFFITEYGLCEPAHTGGDVRRIFARIELKSMEKAEYIAPQSAKFAL